MGTAASAYYYAVPLAVIGNTVLCLRQLAYRRFDIQPCFPLKDNVWRIGALYSTSSSARVRRIAILKRPGATPCVSFPWAARP